MEFWEQVINGLALGSIYALLALGYTMVYGIIRLINFAHGDILMLGAFAGYFILTGYGVNPYTYVSSFFVSMLVCAFIGVIIERTCYKPLRSAPRINALIVALGVSLFIENGARVFKPIGPNFREFPKITEVNLPLSQWLNLPFKLDLSLIVVIVVLVSLAFMLLLNLLVKKTKIGKAMRAVSFDGGAASLMGINVNRIISFTFAIGSALAAVAGILYASAYPQVEPNMGIIPGLKAFIAAVLGGIGSISGAMIGGYILGVAETFTKGFISSKLADAIAFGILILILVLKPSGIMGKNVSEKV